MKYCKKIHTLQDVYDWNYEFLKIMLFIQDDFLIFAHQYLQFFIMG